MKGSLPKRKAKPRVVTPVGKGRSGSCSHGRPVNLNLRAAEPANLFSAGQKMKLQVSHDQAGPVTVTAIVRDERGQTVTRGSVSVGAGQDAKLSFALPPGYYECTVKAGDGSSRTTIAAVVDALPPEVPNASSPFGVQTHFQQNMNVNVIPLLRLGGIRHVRDEQIWQVVESTAGRYGYDAYAPYMAALGAAGIEPLLTADFANPNYDGENTPYTAAGTQAFGRYAADLARRWSPQVGAVEVWNEYNGSFCAGPATADRPASYANLLAATYDAVKAASPKTLVVGGATVLIPGPYFDQLFAHGAYHKLDAYGVHPYYAPPEAIPRYVANLRAAEARHSGGSPPKPIWATECGLDQGDDGSNAKRELGLYLVKLFVTLLSLGVERVYWYLSCDWGSFNTGLLHGQDFAGGSYAPTVAFVAFAAINKRLAGATFLGRDATADRRTFAYRFRDRDGGEVRVLYSTRPGPSPLRVIPAAAEGVRVLNFKGAPVTNPAATGRGPATTQPGPPLVAPFTLTLADEPVYLLGAVATIEETYPDRLLADSLLDFDSSAQGVRGWSYGWRTDQDPTFRAGTPGDNGYDYLWAGPHYYLVVQDGGAQGSGGRDAQGRPFQAWATRRYTPTFATVARLVGHVDRATLGQGDGAGFKIFQGPRELFSADLGTTAGTAGASFDLSVTLKAGEPLDFCVTPGPGTDNAYDACSFQVQIITPA